jgi:hypothetical protein
MRLRVSVILIGLMAMAVLVAACGGGSSSGGGSSTSASTASSGETGESTQEASTGEEGGSEEGEEAEASGEPLNKKELVLASDKICERVPSEFNVTLKKIEKEAPGKKQLSTKVINEKASLPPLYVAVESFQALNPEESQEAAIEGLTKALESAVKGLEANPEGELVGPKSPFAEFAKLSKAYGLQFCGNL